MKRLRYFSTFSGIGGFELGIMQAYESLQNIPLTTELKHEAKDSAGVGQGGMDTDSGGEGLGYTSNQPTAGAESNADSGGVASISELNADPICVGYSEVNKYATQIYQSHFPEHKNYGDITKIVAEDLPDFDLLVGGFPCQSFSVAGLRKGFEDVRGTLFFDLARILQAKRPRLFLFENVKGLLSHDNGTTFGVIIKTLDELGYDLQWQVLNSKDFGVPQNRERIFIIGHLRGQPRPEVFPLCSSNEEDNGIPEQQGYPPTPPINTLTTRYGTSNGSGAYITERTVDAQIGTLRTHKDGQGFRESKSGLVPTIPARGREDGSGQPVVAEARPIQIGQGPKSRAAMAGTVVGEEGDPAYTIRSSNPNGVYIKNVPHGHNPGWEKELPNLRAADGASFNEILMPAIRRLTPIECERLQGFPDKWTEGVSDSQRYKCTGNAVTVNVIKAICEQLLQF